MDGKTLAAAMTYGGYPLPLPQSRYDQLAPLFNTALLQASCTTAARSSMASAQLGAESGSFRWTEELASGEEYEYRRDLGNIYPGDGPRFKGRSFIQITGRSNYTRLSQWAHAKGYVASPTFFVDHPTELAADQYIFLGFVWYWTVARPQLNRLADAHDIYDATLAVNGGTNNLSGRTARWNKCLTLGAAMTPTPVHTLETGAVDVARIVKDKKTNRRYLLVGARPPLHISAKHAAGYADLLGLPRQFPVVDHEALLDYEHRLLNTKSKVKG